MIPLIIQVPANALTNRRINNAPVTDLTLFEILVKIFLYETLYMKPIEAPKRPDKININ